MSTVPLRLTFPDLTLCIWPSLSPSSVNRYINDLVSGCRCVELDCWWVPLHFLRAGYPCFLFHIRSPPPHTSPKGLRLPC